MKNINTTIFHPAWVTGFISFFFIIVNNKKEIGEGTFFVDLLKNNTMALGIQVQLQFTITQHIRDRELMQQFVEFFNAGTIVSDGPLKVQFRIRRFADFENSLFVLLDEYPLMTQKRLDAECFRKVHALMKENKHLTSQGLEQIRAIKATMNRARMVQYRGA